MADLRGHFRPEFLNRVDDIVLFKPLTLEEIEKIVDLQVEDLRRRLAGRRMSLELTEAARVFIAAEGYDPVYGARPLKRFISHELETRIGRALLAGAIEEGSTIEVDVHDDELVVGWRGGAEADEAESREAVGAPG
jgi:ATP-dependent Clp protease ATP-binding subunit ClpB